MNDINITYNNGRGKMCIHLDYFLPTTQMRFKKLLSIIELDYYHQEELKATLEAYMIERLADLENQLVQNARIYSSYRQQSADLNRLVESGTHPNGVKVTKKGLDDAKERLSIIDRLKKKTESDIHKNKTSIERMKKHLEILTPRK